MLGVFGATGVHMTTYRPLSSLQWPASSTSQIVLQELLP